FQPEHLCRFRQSLACRIGAGLRLPAHGRARGTQSNPRTSHEPRYKPVALDDYAPDGSVVCDFPVRPGGNVAAGVRLWIVWTNGNGYPCEPLRAFACDLAHQPAL